MTRSQVTGLNERVILLHDSWRHSKIIVVLLCSLLSGSKTFNQAVILSSAFSDSVVI